MSCRKKYFFLFIKLINDSEYSINDDGTPSLMLIFIFHPPLSILASPLKPSLSPFNFSYPRFLSPPSVTDQIPLDHLPLSRFPFSHCTVRAHGLLLSTSTVAPPFSPLTPHHYSRNSANLAPTPTAPYTPPRLYWRSIVVVHDPILDLH